MWNPGVGQNGAWDGQFCKTIVTEQVWRITQFFLFPFVKKSLICLEPGGQNEAQKSQDSRTPSTADAKLDCAFVENTLLYTDP